MTAINFPNAPAVNDTYVVGGVTYTWDGVKWQASLVIGTSQLENGAVTSEKLASSIDLGSIA